MHNTNGVSVSENSTIPQLTGDAASARDHDGSHIQIIASAGSGKTETVSQRVARLVADGVEPSEIVAFTFTTRAADELKSRIRERVEHVAGEAQANKLGSMYVGTIHGFCFQMLTQHVATYESYDVMDEKQATAFVQRWASQISVKQFSPKNALYDGIARFLQNVDVVENEMIELDQLPPDFAESLETYYGLLDEHRLLTYGLQIGRAVEELEKPEVRERIAASIKHLIVDEYQDVNPAQERLVQLLSKPIGSADLVVVGDDDQAIYQWRGSTVENITTFAERYENVTQFQLLTNRRSRPGIVGLANDFAHTIDGRLDKSMLPDRPDNGPAVDIVTNHATEADEAEEIARTIQLLRGKGFNYRDMAILVRGRVSYKVLMEKLEEYGIPLQPGDRTGLFEQADADFLGRFFAWLVDYQWKAGQYSSTYTTVDAASLKDRAADIYGVTGKDWLPVDKYIHARKRDVETADSRQVSLVDIAYRLCGLLGVPDWDVADPIRASRLGTIARFVQFVADYEAAMKHSRVSNKDGESHQVGTSDQGSWYFKNFAGLMTNYANGTYRDFEGEEDLVSDSVELMTIHAAKGLEWPIVFLPSLTKSRFPSSKSGRQQDWIVPRDLFQPERYEGSDADERRLFYVAMTRAREWLSLSAHERVTTRKGAISPYIEFASDAYELTLDEPPAWNESNGIVDDQTLQITYSELADYLNCGLSYRLRNRIGFPPAIVEQIGYGRAVHHLLRTIAEETQRTGRSMKPADVDRILAQEFFLPFAGRAVSDNLRAAARKLVFGYLDKHGSEMHQVWQTERPFELAVDGALISGRADVILDVSPDRTESLAILDYKTSVSDQDFGLQLQVYAEAGTREGLEVRGAFVHELGSNDRTQIDTSAEARAQAVKTVETAVGDIKSGKFDASPSKPKCTHCDVRALCRKSMA